MLKGRLDMRKPILIFALLGITASVGAHVYLTARGTTLREERTAKNVAVTCIHLSHQENEAASLGYGSGKVRPFSETCMEKVVQDELPLVSPGRKALLRRGDKAQLNTFCYKIFSECRR